MAGATAAHSDKGPAMLIEMLDLGKRAVARLTAKFTGCPCIPRQMWADKMNARRLRASSSGSMLLANDCVPNATSEIICSYSRIGHRWERRSQRAYFESVILSGGQLSSRWEKVYAFC